MRRTLTNNELNLYLRGWLHRFAWQYEEDFNEKQIEYSPRIPKNDVFLINYNLFWDPRPPQNYRFAYNVKLNYLTPYKNAICALTW